MVPPPLIPPPLVLVPPPVPPLIPPPLISVIVPTFRREALLVPLLRELTDLARATPAVLEILVVDNSPEGSARAATAGACPVARYLHEPRPGVAHARNRGVDAAQGTYILFIDDDEMPLAGWLGAFVAQAQAGVDACFGPVEPDFAGPVPPGLARLLGAIFSRDIPAAEGADISGWRAYLGTGNSMFRKAACFPHGGGFNLNFNGGGEDVWLLRELVEDRGIRLIWAPGARVREIVPADRMTSAFVRRRKFRDGQLRCIIEAAAGGPRAVARVGFWMAVGAVQFAGYGVAALLAPLLTPVLDTDRATEFEMRRAGGLGKLLWWRDAA